MKEILGCVIAIVCIGCSPQTENRTAAEQKPVVQDVVDTISQRKALEAGRKAGQQIREVQAEQNQKLQEVESQ